MATEHVVDVPNLFLIINLCYAFRVNLAAMCGQGRLEFRVTGPSRHIADGRVLLPNSDSGCTQIFVGGDIVMSNGFNEVGFLGDDLGSWRDAAYAEFQESFSIADRMNRMGMRIIHEFPEGDFPEARVLAIAGFYRGLQSFQSTVLLAERGAMSEARAMARLCCEAVIVTAGLLKVEGTVEKLHEDRAKHCLALANSMIEMNQKANTTADLTPFEREVKKVKAQYPDGPKSLKLGSLSAQAGLSNLYELSFRFPSGDGAHVTLGALHRHFDKNEQEEMVGMVFHPDKSDLRATLLAANAALAHLLGLAQEFMGLNHYEAEIRDLLLQWKVNEKELGNLPDLEKNCEAAPILI